MNFVRYWPESRDSAASSWIKRNSTDPWWRKRAHPNSTWLCWPWLCTNKLTSVTRFTDDTDSTWRCMNIPFSNLYPQHYVFFGYRGRNVVRGYASKSAHPVFASKSAHSHVIRWLIDWLSTRICLKVCAPRFCFKVCALPCYPMVDWLIEYEDMPQSLRTPFLLQSLRTPMLFDGWLIDWVRGYASKSAHPVFASKSAHSHVIRWLIDWLSTRTCLKVCAL